MRVAPPLPEVDSAALELSLLLGHGVHDRLHPVLARGLALPLVTADRRMRQEAERAGLEGQAHLLDETDRPLVRTAIQ